MVDSRALPLLLLATIGAGCTLISDFDVRACRDDAECAFPEGGVARCEQRRCVPGCRDNHHCASWDPRTPICPRFDGDCVSLTSSGGECDVSTGYVDETMGTLVATDMLIIGAFLPAPESSAWLTIELATSELACRGGLLDASGAAHPVVAVACDPVGDALEPAARHLVDDLGVSSVISTLDTVSLSSAVSLPETRDSTLIMSVRGTATELSLEPTPTLWQLGAPAASAATLYPALLERIDRGLIARRGEGTLPSIVSLVSEAAEDIALADTVLPALTLRGVGGQQLLREDRHRRLTLSDTDPDRRGAVLADASDYSPDIVLVFAGGFFAAPNTEERAGVIRALEDGVAEGEQRPLYVFGPTNVADAALRTLARDSASFRARAFGIASAATFDSDLARALDVGFFMAFPLAQTESSALAYDAFYQLAYGLAAARGEAGQSGLAATVAGLARTADSNAQAVPVGPSGLTAATGLLSNGAQFNLMGITGAALGSRHLREAAPAPYCFATTPGADVAERPRIELVFDDPSSLGARVGRECAEEALP